MLGFEIATQVVMLCAFFYGAIKLWKRGKPLFFQIIICAIGCCVLYDLAVIVMTFCDVNETLFNNSFFGLFGCYSLLFCANRGATGKLFEKPSKKALVFAILAGVLILALSVLVAIFYFSLKDYAFYLFVLMQIPACFIVYFNVKHLLTPPDKQGFVKAMRLTDIFSLLFCVLIIADIACWINVGLLSGIADLITAFAMVGLSISAVKGAEKWNS